MRQDLDDATVYEVVRGAVAHVLDLDAESLHPDSAVILLDIDSLTAAELLIQTQTELGVPIDFRRLARDWSDFTLTDLAAELARCARPAADANGPTADANGPAADANGSGNGEAVAGRAESGARGSA